MDLDELAQNEPPHQDLHCLQIQLYSSLVVKELKQNEKMCHAQKFRFPQPITRWAA